MLENLFSLLESVLTKSLAVTVLASFTWGILSILLSPCHLSGIPVAILTTQKTAPRPSLVPGLFSFGIVLSLIVIAGVTFGIGQSLLKFSVSSSWVLAVVLLFSGIVMLDLVPLNFSFSQPSSGSTRSLRPVVVGLFFGLLVGPCTLAFAMPIVVASGLTAGRSTLAGLALFASFSLGHVLATMVFGTSLSRTSNWLKKQKSISTMKTAVGVALILGGLYYLYSALAK